MSDITPVLEDGAKDLAKSGEQAGKAVEKHLGQDIGGGLDGAAKNYKDVDDLHGQKFDEINPNKAADGAQESLRALSANIAELAAPAKLLAPGSAVSPQPSSAVAPPQDR